MASRIIPALSLSLSLELGRALPTENVIWSKYQSLFKHQTILLVQTVTTLMRKILRKRIRIKTLASSPDPCGQHLTALVAISIVFEISYFDIQDAMMSDARGKQSVTGHSEAEESTIEVESSYPRSRDQRSMRGRVSAHCQADRQPALPQPDALEQH